MFSLRPSDRNHLAILFLLIIVAVILFPILSNNEKETKYARDYVHTPHNTHKNTSTSKPTLFPFDPNTADSAQFARLGLRPWQIRTIYKYRSKGGHYYRKEDFAQLYGLTLEQYRRLEPYIKIKSETMARDVIKPSSRIPIQVKGDLNTQQELTPSIGRSEQSYKLHAGETIDVNTADTTELKRIPGIGSYFARRIVELRQRRQAFTSSEELLSIRNFPETALTYMTCSDNFQSVHINKANLQQLKSHPLINHTQATDILRYRRLNGDIHSVNDISMLPSFTKEQLARLAPFLLFDK